MRHGSSPHERYTLPMSSVRSRVLCVLLFVLTLGMATCGDDPPEKEMQQAQAAIDAARAAGADEYAHKELVAAVDALKQARDAVSQRDYRLALNDAIESRERAQSAAQASTDQKATVRAEAERAIREASAALAQTRAELKAAEGRRTPARLLNEARRNIESCEEAVQKARAVVGRGEYRDVAQTLGGQIARLAATARDLDSAGGPPPRRRR